MKNIRNILVPTDFSATSRNAYHYAKRLADTIDATITVVHVDEYSMPVADFSMVPLATINTAPLLEDEKKRLSQAELEMFIAEEDTSDGWLMVQTQVKTKVLQGSIVGSLVEASESNDTDLMVVGTTGLQDFLAKIIGSTSLELANKAHCPIILVPQNAQWHGLERVMYASNYESATPKMIREIADFALSINATIHFVHIKDAHSEAKSKVTDTVWDELFAMADPNLSFKIYSIYETDKMEDLKKYAEENNIDLMVFVSRHRSFWGNLMHKSVTENIALSTNTPMMVLHLDDEK